MQCTVGARTRHTAISFNRLRDRVRRAIRNRRNRAADCAGLNNTEPESGRCRP
jgi:hypothetical protein